MSSTFEWNDIVGCLPCDDGWSCGPPGQASSDFLDWSEMQARPVDEPDVALLESLELLLGELDVVDALALPDPFVGDLSAARAAGTPPKIPSAMTTAHREKTRFIFTSRTST
jgi:hypothetical protein